MHHVEGAKQLVGLVLRAIPEVAQLHLEATKQLLGFLSGATPADAQLMIAKAFQSTSVGFQAWVSTHEAGEVYSHQTVVYSTAELWQLLRVRYRSP